MKIKKFLLLILTILIVDCLMFDLEENGMVQQLVYSCNLDQTQCFGQPLPFFENNPGSIIFELTSQSKINDRFSFMTDVTSTMVETANGLKCQIPYVIEPIEYYHCRPYPDFDCLTTNGSMAKCTEGRFLVSKSNDLGEPFNNAFYFRPLGFDKPTELHVSFYLLYWCDGDAPKDCQTKQEYIRFTINNTNHDFTYVDFPDKPMWVKKTIMLNFTAPIDRVLMSVTFVRQEAMSSRSTFGFDHLEIFKLVEEIETTTTTTTTTTDSEEISTLTSTTTDTLQLLSTSLISTSNLELNSTWVFIIVFVVFLINFVIFLAVLLAKPYFFKHSTQTKNVLSIVSSDDPSFLHSKSDYIT